VLATIHRLLRAERESLPPRIANLGFDREHYTPHLAPLISTAVHGARPNETQDQRPRPGSARGCKLDELTTRKLCIEAGGHAARESIATT
jgi:hypothetical protein